MELTPRKKRLTLREAILEIAQDLADSDYWEFLSQFPNLVEEFDPILGVEPC